MVCRNARVKNLRATRNGGWAVGCLFIDPLAAGDIVVQESRHAPKPTYERRSKPRYSTRFERGQCRVLNMFIEGPWEMVVHNVSESGIGLIADRPFKPGMILFVQMPGHEEPSSLRVAHSSKHGKAWLVGCEFGQPLSRQELRALT
jgi:hypothetical protein